MLKGFPVVKALKFVGMPFIIALHSAYIMYTRYMVYLDHGVCLVKLRVRLNVGIMEFVEREWVSVYLEGMFTCVLGDIIVLKKSSFGMRQV